MFKNIVGGIAVGIANVIPGVSGGTMMVLLGIFDKIMEAIPGVLAIHSPKRKEYFIFLLQVLVGAGIGLVGFAKVLEYLFEAFPIQTVWWFIGLIAFSIPVFVKGEMKGHKISLLPLLIGMAVVIGLEMLNPGDVTNTAVTYPPLNALTLISMVGVGFIAGFTMFLPGVSGSMVLLIIGKYHLFKSYLANVTSFDLNILIPLGFMGIGIIAGIIVSSKVISVAFKVNKGATLNLLLGLIIASTIVLVFQTFTSDINMMLVATSLLSFLFGGLIVYILNHYVK